VFTAVHKEKYPHHYVKGPDWSHGSGESVEAKWNIEKAMQYYSASTNDASRIIHHHVEENFKYRQNRSTSLVGLSQEQIAKHSGS
jgi:hypothetical protein